MKKIICTLLAVLTVLSFAGCMNRGFGYNTNFPDNNNPDLNDNYTVYDNYPASDEFAGNDNIPAPTPRSIASLDYLQ